MMTKEERLRLIVKAAKRARVKIGIGGGIAVAAHGYRRETEDVDAFFHHGAQNAILGALRRLRPKLVIEQIDTSHWIVYDQDDEPENRIDLLFASGDPEESAIEMSKSGTYKKIVAPVFPVDMLVVCKYLASRDEAKDWLDIYALYQRGAFTVQQIQKRLRQMGLSSDAVSFAEFLNRMLEMKKR